MLPEAEAASGVERLGRLPDAREGDVVPASDAPTRNRRIPDCWIGAMPDSATTLDALVKAIRRAASYPKNDQCAPVGHPLGR